MARSKKACFFIAPIGREGSDARMQSDMALDYVVRPALGRRYRIKRADEDAVPRLMSPQMIRDIDRADLIVCDLTGLNPNVMYELGVAHALAKPVIQIAAVETDLPFDLAQFWTIFVDLKNPVSHRKASAHVGRAEEGLRRARRVSNPVTDGLDHLSSEDIRNATSAYDRLLSRVEALEGRAPGASAADPAGRTTSRAEQALETAIRTEDGKGGKRQAEAAGQLIDLLASRSGFERVAVDRANEQRLIVYGDSSLDAADVADLVDGFEVDLRLARRRA